MLHRSINTPAAASSAVMPRRSPTVLPSLNTPPSYYKLMESAPPDLRGGRYAKLPNSASNFDIYDDDDDEHPLPFYSADEETFAPVKEMPWVIEKKKKAKEMDEAWRRNPAIAEGLVADLLKEALAEEVGRIAKSVLNKAQTSAEADKQINTFLNEELLPEGINDAVLLVAWQTLYDVARALPPDQLRGMKQQHRDLSIDDRDLEALSGHIVEGTEWLQALRRESRLAATPWSVLVYNYGTRLSKKALTCNAALNLLQEQVSAGAALAELVSVGLLVSAEDDLADIDELERVTSPPRRG